jgi:hypothetical protein
MPDPEADSGVAVGVAEPPPSAEVTPAIPATPSQSPQARLVVSDYQKMSIWQAFERMTQDDWSDKMVYIVRSFPFTVNIHTGLKYGSIFKGGYPGITEEQIQDNFGGGKFRLWLNMGKMTMCNAHAGPYPGKPKLLPDEDLMLTQHDGEEAAAPAADAGNEMLLKILDRLLNEREAAQATGDTKSADSIGRALDIVTNAAKRANDMVADSNKPQTLESQVATFTAIKNLIEPKDKDESLTKLLITKLLDRAFATPAASATAANPVDQLNATMDLVEKLQERFGEGPRGGSDWKSLLIQAIPAVVEHLAQMAKTIQSRPIVVNMPRNFRPGPGAPPPGPAMIPVDALPFNPADMGGAPQPLDEGEIPSPTPDTRNPAPAYELAPLDHIKRRLVAMFYRGKPGDLCASFIEDAAPALYEHLKGQSAETLLPFMQTDPILSEIAGQPGIKEWLEELVTFVKDVESETPETAKVN